MNSDRSLAGLGFIIAWPPLSLLVGPPVVLAEAGELQGSFPLPPVLHGDDLCMGVVPRNRPDSCPGARDWHLILHVFLGRKLVHVGRHEVGYPYPRLLPYPPGGDVHHANGRLDEVQLGVAAEVRCETDSRHNGVQVLQVGWVHAVFLYLKPVAGHYPPRARLQAIFGCVQRI